MKKYERITLKGTIVGDDIERDIRVAIEKEYTDELAIPLGVGEEYMEPPAKMEIASGNKRWPTIVATLIDVEKTDSGQRLAVYDIQMF